MGNDSNDNVHDSNEISNKKCNDDHDNNNNTNHDNDNDTNYNNDNDNDNNHAHTMNEINDIIKNKSDVNITNNISTKSKNQIKKSRKHHQSISPGFHAYDNDGDIGISGIYMCIYRYIYVFANMYINVNIYIYICICMYIHK
jgi:hypothetical protein